MPMETESPLLPSDPPSFVLRAIGWLLGAAALAAALIALFVTFPETVRCPFVLVSETGDEALLAPIQAVLAEVKLVEGAEVAQGDTLFVLRSDEIRHWQSQRSTQREELHALEARRLKLDEIEVSQLSAKDAHLVQLQREVAFREKQLATNREFLESMEKLDTQGGVPRIEMLNLRLNLAASEKELFIAQKWLLQGGLELDQIKIERARQRIDEASTAETLRIRLGALEQQLEHCEGDRMHIRAPYDAVVIALDRRSGGNLVRAGDSLAQLSRRGGQPQARLRLDESALSRLQSGQRVRFFFDAFPYQRHGTMTGRLEWITPAAVTAKETSHFMAVASLNPAGTPSLPLRVGMKGEARIVVGSRTLVEHIFEPIRQLRENLRP